MANICKPVINSSKKLKKLNYILILILLIFILLFVLNYFYIHIDKSHFYIMLAIILSEIIASKYYNFVKLFSFALFISLINNLNNLGLLIQNNFSIIKYDIRIYYYIFVILFHITSFLISHEIFKEAKAIYIGEYGKKSKSSELSDYNN